MFIYHHHHDHTTLYINNNNLHSHTVTTIDDYTNLATDSFKAWLMPDSGEHWMANRNHEYHLDELQIFGNAHLAILPKPFTEGALLDFRYMIGDRSGVIHVGPYQVMDLHRPFLDVPFSAYVYDQGYLGLAPIVEVNKVFLDIKGTLDHIIDITMISGGNIHFHQTGSTNSLPRLNVVFNGTTIIKDGKPAR